MLAELWRHKHMWDVPAKQISLEEKHKWWSETQPKMVKGWGLAMENSSGTSRTSRLVRILGANELYSNTFQSEVCGTVLGSSEWLC